jgi:hypothetical protein
VVFLIGFTTVGEIGDVLITLVKFLGGEFIELLDEGLGLFF